MQSYTEKSTPRHRTVKGIHLGIGKLYYYMPCCAIWVCTVKLVYKDYPRNPQKVVLIHKWPLYAGSNKMTIISLGACETCLCKQMAFIYSWSLEKVHGTSNSLFPLKLQTHVNVKQLTF